MAPSDKPDRPNWMRYRDEGGVRPRPGRPIGDDEMLADAGLASDADPAGLKHGNAGTRPNDSTGASPLLTKEHRRV